MLCVGFLLFSKGIEWGNNFTLHIMHLIWRELENYLVTDFSDQACKVAYIMLMGKHLKMNLNIKCTKFGFWHEGRHSWDTIYKQVLVNSFFAMAHNHALCLKIIPSCNFFITENSIILKTIRLYKWSSIIVLDFSAIFYAQLCSMLFSEK